VGIQDEIWLDEGQKEKGIPDIVLHRDGRSHMVLDTKYKIFKGVPSPNDRNQMLVYCQTLNLMQGMLIYANEHKVQYDGMYSGTLLSARALSLNGRLDQFRDSCEQFAKQFSEGT
jgi:5-methylcytosine-specific restriction endonuclease McrBC regulatory subunit McrC